VVVVYVESARLRRVSTDGTAAVLLFQQAFVFLLGHT